MKVEIVSTQKIRPAAAGASLTPVAAKRSFTLSIFDQLMPALYIPILLFYSPTDLQISAKSDILKKSLSETLTHFFPLAGRISDNLRISVDEESAGIEYTEARVRGKLLRDILSPPDLEAIGELLPAVKNSESTERLLLVRESVFECGGFAIGICISHKVADATTIYSFLKSWSATARGAGSSRSSDPPYLSSPSRFQPLDALATSTYTTFPEQKRTTRRFVLSGSQLASLKAKSRSQSVAHPTKVEAVTSLIWHCAMASKSNMKNNPSTSLSSGIWQAVNLRNRIDPPLPETTFGNLLGYYKTSTTTKEEEKAAVEDDLANLVYKIRHAKEEYMQVYLKKLDQARDPSSAVCESFSQMLSGFEENNGGGTYFISSVCKLDLYGAGDFGWGKPIWATFYINFPTYVYLSDTIDKEGIQVWVSLPKQQMDVFEKDPLLLSFAAPNPSINVFHQQTTSPPHRTFARVSSPWLHYCPTLLLRPNLLSQILRRPAAVYSTRPPLCNIHGRTIAPPPSIRFFSSLLHLRRHKLIIR